MIWCEKVKRVSSSPLFTISLKFIPTRKPHLKSTIFLDSVAPKTNNRGFRFYHWWIVHGVNRGDELTLFTLSPKFWWTQLLVLERILVYAEQSILQPAT